MSDIPDVIFDFVSNLPLTIRLDELVFIVAYATDDYSALYGDYKPLSELEPHLLSKLNEFLHQPGGLRPVGAVLCVVSAIDHVLSRSAKKLKSAGPALKQLAARNPTFEYGVAGHPLRQRHTEKALADWAKLRKTTITAQTLRDFEDMCLNSRRQK